MKQDQLLDGSQAFELYLHEIFRNLGALSDACTELRDLLAFEDVARH